MGIKIKNVTKYANVSVIDSFMNVGIRQETNMVFALGSSRRLANS